MKTTYTYNPASVPESLLQDPRLQGLGPQVLTILYKRGLRSSDAIRDFITSDMDTLLRCTEMRDTGRAVDILARAIRSGDRIVVYRDYDCDGCSAGAVVLECLAGLGARVEQYTNRRSTDGYGVCSAGIRRILEFWPDTAVLVTVDCGITSLEGTALARKAGLQVIVTDHHEAGATLPDADAILDPKCPGEIYPFPHLCGAGVAFKLMLALCQAMGRDTGLVLRTLDLVALATVADVVPLTGENRTIVREGLKMINALQRPFFQALMEQTGSRDITASGALAFLFAPMVNSFSRLDQDTDEVVRLMLSRDRAELNRGVRRMMDLNEHRKAITQEESDAVMADLQDRGQTSILVRRDSLTEGVIGIIAGKIREAYNRPAAVMTRNAEGILKGSARSVDAVPLKQTLDRIPEGILLTHGGHALAAGFSLLPENYEAFVRAFTALTDQALAGSDFRETREIDLVLQEEECTQNLIRQLDLLEPFGAGCPSPLFGLRASPTSVTYMGQQSQHVKYHTRSGLQIIQWNRGEQARRTPVPPKKFVGTPQLNVWRNTCTVQFVCRS